LPRGYPPLKRGAMLVQKSHFSKTFCPDLPKIVDFCPFLARKRPFLAFSGFSGPPPKTGFFDPPKTPPARPPRARPCTSRRLPRQRSARNEASASRTILCIENWLTVVTHVSTTNIEICIRITDSWGLPTGRGLVFILYIFIFILVFLFLLVPRSVDRKKYLPQTKPMKQMGGLSLVNDSVVRASRTWVWGLTGVSGQGVLRTGIHV